MNAKNTVSGGGPVLTAIWDRAVDTYNAIPFGSFSCPSSRIVRGTPYIKYGDQCDFSCNEGYMQPDISAAESNYENEIKCRADGTVSVPHMAHFTCIDRNECLEMTKKGTPPCNGHGTCVDSTSGLVMGGLVSLGQIRCAACDVGWKTSDNNCTTDIDECEDDPWGPAV